MARPSVAFIGNMNNNHFSIARYLRDRGVDAHVLMYHSDFEHFHPACDSYDSQYESFCRTLSWPAETRFRELTRERLRAEFDAYDVLVGCGIAPAYAYRMGRPLDIFCPYGGDIWGSTFYRFTGHPVRWPAQAYQVYARRRGIRSAAVFHMSRTNDLYERRYAKLAGNSTRWFEGMPMVYGPMYAAENIDGIYAGSRWTDRFAQLRSGHDLMVVYHGRHVWRKGVGPEPAAKGVERLLAGWARFVKSAARCNAVLVMLEYGEDVERTRAYARELGIQDSTAWLPQMYRKDLMAGIHMADLVCGEFENSWMMSGILFEAMVAGKPIMAYRDDALYADEYPDLYPIVNAREPDDIAAALVHCSQSRASMMLLGKQGREWYERRVVEPIIQRYLSYVERKMSLLRKGQ
ncbi:glycosyltransferase [Bordetella genomosp. 7]|uniref:glycosyltransferase n=1 Tax=Bordetella genomosp. 7 TaxID=1416805 RepID=UPI00113FD9CF|nr:glycosyltransferase [Bordetella genomosp. 7]